MLEHVSRVLVIEELEPVVEEQVAMLAGKINPSIQILGKEKEIPREGELDLITVRNALARMNGLGILRNRLQ